ncbi:MAG: primosomal protein N' [FCB group bacterium]|jgi:primosomal protein N' (replication factor Y)|nr:primosomal protein N' [FCB group bacterium]
MSQHRFAEVVLPMPLDQPFTYAVPEGLRERIAVGMRAVVPFGNRVDTGYVVGLLEEAEREKLKAIVELPDAGPVFTSEMLELCKWLSQYYCCSWGEALDCAIPAGIQIRSRKRYSLIEEAMQPGKLSERQRKVLAELKLRGPLTEMQLAKVAGPTGLGSTLQSLVTRGVLDAEVVTESPTVNAQTETWFRLLPEAIPDGETLASMQRRAPKQAAVYLDMLHGEPERASIDLCEKHDANTTILRGLEQKGLVERFQRDVYRAPQMHFEPANIRKHSLNRDQLDAYAAIVAALEAARAQTFLLRGITGSGKTEVYLQVIERALALGRSAIVLVPEISLTPQTVARFVGRFKTQIAVLHSGLGAGERYDEWRRAQQGDVRIVVGARSAIFAPLSNLGVIVVDEEHDTSYKQSEVPRYHARDVAIMRANLSKAVCVLGSATPSVESYHNSESGKSTRIELRSRATNASLPEVLVVDMRNETREAGGDVTISRVLETAVNERVAEGEQVLLLLNRRGYSPYVLCPQCGWLATCPDCQVSMTYHSHGGYLNCHYCNARRSVPQVCDECHFNPLLYLGTGTQKVEELLERTFQGARIARMDADTTARKGGHARILRRLASGEVDILIGTQMIAKGHDYPGVTLVGVINADTGLAHPDFRAAENTFQLLTQVAGRAGRGDLPGRVIVQSFRPNHYAIRAAASHDYPAFYSQEIAQRESSAYPPFRRMGILMIECEDPLEAEKAMARLSRMVREQIEGLGFRGMETLGPSPATLRRLRKKYRWNLAVLSKSAKRINTLTRTVRQLFEAEYPGGKVQLKVDLDPYGIF